jgi:transposase-like protein
MSILTKPHFHDEASAFKMVESIIWPHGPVCPHCGEAERIYVLNGVRSKPSKKNPEGILRHGLKKCGACRKQFTVRVGTLFEDSHLPLRIWLQAFHLLCSSKKGISSHQLHRTLEITYEAAWFLSHRIREAMRCGSFAVPMGGAGGVVEVDETFIGNKPGAPVKRGYGHKNAILSLVDRKSGEVRSFHVDGTKASDLIPIIKANVAKETAIMTDEAGQYHNLGADFASHESVNHGKEEYVRGDVHTNTVEGYYSVFKRGMKGVYQHCKEKHLHRYVAEFDFRYTNRTARGCEDQERAARALQGVKGKRLTYRISDAQNH